MKNLSLPLFYLLRPTFSFFFDLKRIWHLIAIPAVLTFVIVFIQQRFFPFFDMGITVQPTIVFNFNSIAVVILALLLIFISVMVRVHQIIFFGEENKNIFFIPVVKKDDLRYLLSFFKIFIFSIFIACAITSVIILLIKKFIPDFPPPPPIYIVLGTTVFIPYFLVRFFAVLPATVAKKENSLFGAWRLTSGNGVILSIYYMLTALTPLLIIAGIASVFPKDLEVVANAFSFLGLLLSCMVQASFMSYLYPTLKEQI